MSRVRGSVDARVGMLDGVDVDVVFDGCGVAVWAGGVEVGSVAGGEAAVGIRDEIEVGDGAEVESPTASEALFTEVGIDEDRQESCQFDFAQLSHNWLRLSDAFIKRTNDGAPIEIAYEPSNDEYAYAAEIFIDSQIFEAVSAELMDNYSLPNPAKFTGKNCDTPNAYYDPSTNEVVMCYELTAMFLDLIVEDILAHPEG